MTLSQSISKLLTIAEVAQVLNLQYPRTADLIRRSVIPAVRIGRQVRVSPDALNAFIEGGGYKLRRRRAAGSAMNTDLGAFNADEISALYAARVPRLKVPRKWREVDRHEYLDRAGDLRFEVLRYLNADGSKRFSHRTIREEPKFDEQRAKLGVSHKRLDEVLAAFHYALCHAPERYPRVPGTTLRVLKTSVYPGAPSLRIFFTFDEHEVHLITIEFCDEGIPAAFIVGDD